MVQEYESDDLASNSEHEKKIKKAKSSAEKKRKDAGPHGSSGNSFKKSKTSGDNQLFRGKTFPKCLQLFRERLSDKTVRDNAERHHG